MSKLKCLCDYGHALRVECAVLFILSVKIMASKKLNGRAIVVVCLMVITIEKNRIQ